MIRIKWISEGIIFFEINGTQKRTGSRQGSMWRNSQGSLVFPVGDGGQGGSRTDGVFARGV